MASPTAIAVSSFWTGVSGSVASSQVDTSLNAIINTLNIINQYTVYGVDSGGSTTAYVVANPGAPLSANLVAGLGIKWLCQNTSSTTTPTLNVYGTGVKNIVNQDGSALAVNQLANGRIYETIYDGTNWVLMTAAGSGTATSSTTTYFKISGTSSSTNFNGMSVKRTNNLVSLTLTNSILPYAASSSNALTLTYTDNTGTPTALSSVYRPTTINQYVPCIVVASGLNSPGMAIVKTDGTGLLFNLCVYDTGTGLVQYANFLNDGLNKGLPGPFQLIYPVS